MSDQAYQFVAILAYFIAMICIGLWANSKTKNLDDYMLGGRNLKPGVAALSAGASDMSGWLLMGLPGAVYLSGLVEAWLAIGLTAGAWVNWKIVAPRLRAYTEVSHNSITIPSFLDNRLKGNTRVLRVISGVIILVFFTFYVSSGMVAGGVFFQSSFGTSYLTGMLLVAGVTVLYTFFGGFLGASYTDLFQGLLMLIALLLVPIVGVFLVGGPGEMVNRIEAVNPDALSLFAGGTAVGIISSLAWGLGYFGQPHIIVRFMALRTPRMRRPGAGSASAGCCSRCWVRSAPPWWAWRTTATAPARSPPTPRPSSWTCPRCCSTPWWPGSCWPRCSPRSCPRSPRS